MATVTSFSPPPNPQTPAANPRLTTYMDTSIERAPSVDRDQTTIYEQLTARGVSRRDFLKFCGWMSACMGLGADGMAQIAEALETKKRIPVIWMHFQECTCCSESFIRSSHPIVADILLDKISLDYTETLMAPVGPPGGGEPPGDHQEVQR
jgi:hypothetical protein